MQKYIMDSKEFESLDNIITKSGLDIYLVIHQTEELGDCFIDLDENRTLDFAEGLQIIYESDANEICFENKSISNEEYYVVNHLFRNFNIGGIN